MIFLNNIKMWTDLPTVLSQFTRVTDRQTDRILIATPRLHCVQRGKNVVFSDCYFACVPLCSIRKLTASTTVVITSAILLTVQNCVQKEKLSTEEFYVTIDKQDAQLSQRDRAAACVIVFAKSRTLELGDNILRTL